MEEPGSGSLSARCNAPRLSLPAGSAEACSSHELSARSPCSNTDRPPPKSRLPRFTRQPGTDGRCPTVSRPRQGDGPPSKRMDAGVPRCLSMPPSRNVHTPTDSCPPSRLGSSFGAGISTASVRVQQRRTSHSQNGASRRATHGSSQGSLAPPVTSKAAGTRPKQPATSSSQDVRTRTPSLRPPTQTSQKSTGSSAPLPSRTPRHPPHLHPVAQAQSNRATTSLADKRQAGASRANADAAVSAAAPPEPDLADSRGEDDMLLPLGEDELDGDLDEELRAMSFLSTAGPHAHLSLIHI